MFTSLSYSKQILEKSQGKSWKAEKLSLSLQKLSMEKSLYILLPVILMFVVGCSRHSISPSDGGKVSFSSSLSSNTVSSIQRDSLGYLWIGTDRGISIFDGTNYRQLRHDRLDTASLRSDNVLKIYRGNAHMWVMTDQGIDCYAGNGRFVHYHSNAVSSRAACMIERKDGRVIALFGNELCEIEGLTFKRKLSIAGTFHGFDGAFVDDHSGRLLINSNQGLFLVDKDLTKSVLFLKGNNNVVCADSETVCHLSFTQGIVYLRRKDFSILYRSGESMPVVANSAVFWHGEVVFSGNDGLYRITHHGNDHAYTVESLPADITHDSNHQFIKTMYADPKGDLWIGYIMRGLKHLQNMEAWHRRLATDKAFKQVVGKAVVGIVSGNNGEVWGALANDSVFHIDGHTDSVVALPLAGLMPIHSQQHIKGIAFSAGEFWVVTTSNVFALHFDKGIKLDEFYDVGLVQRDVCGRHVSIPNGLVVMAGIDRLIVFDALHRKEEVKDIRMASNRLPVVWQIGDFTVTAKKLVGVNFSSVSNVIAGNNHILISEDQNAWKSINLLTGKVMDTSLPLNANIISSSYQGSHLFLGTDAGLYVYEPYQNRLTSVSGFSGKVINNIASSAGAGALSTMMMTIGGEIVAYDATSHHQQVVWKGTDSDDFQPSTLALLPGSRIMAATRKGLQLFHVASPKEHVLPPAVHLEAIDVLMPKDKVKGTGLFDIDSSSTVVLSHTQNNFKIRYAAISERLADNYTYRYKLDGYDLQWRESNGSGEAAYNEVSPGKYRFIVKCIDRTHPWISRTSSVLIRVKPHPMLSSAAFCVYAMLLLIFIYVFNRMYLRIRMVRINAVTSERERQHEQHVNKMNMDFFANISHEFRNPLTMISGPLAMLGKAPELSKQSANLVRIVMQSATIMRKLVGQMLDFRELEGGAMRLSVSRTDVAAIVADYGHHYELTAVEKGIRIVLQGTDRPLIMFADEDKVIKVFDNLMTNAIRHTPQNGVITVTLKRLNDSMVLSVENSGNQIPETQISRIFEQYYRLDDTVATWGAGLGLHYVKNLVTLHHGQIAATNTDTGVCFTVSLPIDEAAYTEKEKVSRHQNINSYDMNGEGEDEDILRPIHHEEPGLAPEDSRPRLLIVEKDINTAFFLRHLFEGKYKVFNRYEGEKAFNDIDEIKPDIILSCVLLDDMSGLDLCRMLRGDKQYNESFIFLTTCTGGDQQAAGMKAGADYYVTKPFDPDYLQEVVGKASDNARAYEALLRQLPQRQSAKNDHELSKRDRDILRITQKFMKENIGTSELDVNKLGRKLLLSRTKLYEKIKALTGKTPNELFRVYKLNYAASLLKEGKLNVTEVASQAGFSSVAFFSRSFKKHFGVSPKDYS